ncbi:TnsA endonuclease N-terminal domain-containing protein [Sphingobium baderi]|uniref:TnsA endonuclease N-terminal domain-containing protein n=1 Tax=Sphingobium baderi TaxID=1332080 RepID=UPI002B40B1AC|nr:TnsA endonuclease N-terminal domain-containing protein [Sphingobium baderi]WRD75688.1 TnsA endonuclease N-terminal domain-containing protein [Sphingobium baderi]WRD76507.1 TnsA endonuclease N-terminal domain-containing protein [Sphingobium baderi]WRD77090.1 TnsA endonuclease N-terminal domain-containing protein [Sphingobium baderi]WRD78611.1 TnsA endonuclease N-terminal domain-containing protein [Sphingobium baderi]WRD78718.1 TnsA endonuclease N-terminal domain-containing protein [Sphingobi
MSHRSHVTGFSAVPTGMAEHESALERDFVTLSSFADRDAKITSQPVTIRFEHDGERRRYTPDFLVEWSDSRSDLVEVKYWADLRAGWKRFRPAFTAGRRWIRERGGSFRIATDRTIRCPALEAAKRLLPLRRATLDPDLAETTLAMVQMLGEPTFHELVNAVPAAREDALGVIWRMIAQGMLRVDMSVPIVPATRIGLP